MVDITELQVAKLDMKPGDVLIVKSPVALTKEQWEALRESFKIALPKNTRVVFLTSSLELSVLHFDAVA